MGRGVEGSRDRKAERVGGGTWREGEENGERRERETERRAILVFFFSISALRWQAHVWG